MASPFFIPPDGIKEKLFEASYKKAVFFLTRSSITGGRKDTKKEIVNSDFQVIEDLGLRQPIFTLTALVAGRDGDLGYKEMRDKLLDALQEGGRGQLIHPFYGPINNVVARSFTITIMTKGSRCPPRRRRHPGSSSVPRWLFLARRFRSRNMRAPSPGWCGWRSSRAWA